MLKGSKLLRISAVLELIIGIASLLIVWFMVGSADFRALIKEDLASNVLLSITMVYGVHILEIIAGLIGIVKANKKSVLTLILGLIVMVINLVEYFTHNLDTMQIIIQSVSLIVPYLYLHGAFMNWKG